MYYKHVQPQEKWNCILVVYILSNVHEAAVTHTYLFIRVVCIIVEECQEGVLCKARERGRKQGRRVRVCGWVGNHQSRMNLLAPLHKKQYQLRRQGCSIGVAFAGCTSINAWIVCVHVGIGTEVYTSRKSAFLKVLDHAQVSLGWDWCGPGHSWPPPGYTSE